MHIQLDRCPNCGQLYNSTAGCLCHCGTSLPARPAPAPVAAPQGWQCPGCSRYLSPYVNTCPHCLPAAPHYTITWYTPPPHEWCGSESITVASDDEDRQPYRIY